MYHIDYIEPVELYLVDLVSLVDLTDHNDQGDHVNIAYYYINYVDHDIRITIDDV